MTHRDIPRCYDGTVGAAPVLAGGRFELGEWLGEGTLSVVYTAIDRHTGQQVAVKLAHETRDGGDSIRRRFEREAAALSVIASTHVVELISAGTADDGRPFLVLERLSGRDLQEILDAHGPLSPARVVRFIGQAAAALDLAHGLGIVHRDLKPANLFAHATADQELIIKVLDFGMAVNVAGPTERFRDAFGGTPLFMAPEQVRGQLTRIGPATDIWALGLVALKLLVGDNYWSGSATGELLQEILAGTLDPPSLRWPWLPKSFDAWFARSTQRVPERRYPSVAEQAARLAHALRGVRAPGEPGVVSARTPTPSIGLVSGSGISVVGRDIECAEIEQALAPGTLVTVTGTAGIGKTRLARALCDNLGDLYPDGGWFVPLPPGDGETTIAAAIAEALSLAPDSARPVFEHVVTSLAPRHLLLVVDGVEQVRGGADAVARLVASCPAVTWLATGRVPLGIDGERRVGLEPLEVPRDGRITADEAHTFAAVELFVRRTRDAVPDFFFDAHNVNDVVAICRAVNGIPLGVELAAARTATSSLAEIRAALEAGHDGGGAAAPVRAAVNWSFGLLAGDEQRLLRQLALFPGGLTFEQVRARLGHLTGDPVGAVLRLVQSHLVTWSSDSDRRLLMLDTVRELCFDLTARAGDEASLWQAARHHAGDVAHFDADDAGGRQAWLARADAEQDNLRAVLDHLEATDPSAAMELAGQLTWYWYLRGHYAEGSRRLERSIAASGAGEGEQLVRALHGAGWLALLACRYRRAQELLEHARQLAALRGDPRGEASAVQLLGSISRERGDCRTASALHQHSLELWEQAGDPHEAARARNYLLFAAWLGDPAGRPRGVPQTWWEHEVEAELRLLDDPEGVVWALLNRGAILHYLGQARAAQASLARAFAESIAARFHEGIAWSLELIGRASLERGELLQAGAQLAASLRVHRRLGDQWRCASVLEALAAAAVRADRPARGAAYLGAADAIRQAIHAPVPACERTLLVATEARGSSALGAGFEAGRERGRRTPLDEVIALARDVSADFGPAL